MAGICGWSTNGQGNDTAAADLARMAESLGNTGTKEQLCGNRVAVAALSNNPYTGVARSGHLFAAICGVYRWDDQNPAADDHGRNPAETLIEEYRKHGESTPTRLSGSFSLVVANDDSGQILLAVDEFCGRQLAFFRRNDTFVFASGTSSLGNHALFDDTINPNAILAYLYFHNVPLPMSAYQSVTRLQPGYLLNWDGGTTRSRCYTNRSFDDGHRSREPEELAREVKQLLQDDIAGLAGNGKTGAFLSGGVDSSTITGLLTRAAGPCHSFSIGFDAASYDEINFAKTVAEHFGSTHHVYYVTPEDIVEAVPTVAGANSEPFGNASAIPTYYCAKLARDNGMEQLLAGDGGDEIFGGNERYAYDKLLAWYGMAPRSVRSLLERVFLPVNDNSQRLVRKAGNYIRKSATPLPDRLYLDNLLTLLGNATVFEPGFLQTVDEQTPIALIREQYERSNGASRLNRQLALDWYFTLACSDLPKVTNMSDAAGIDVAYPFLCSSVVDFSTHLTDREKVRGFQLRHFFKKAVSNLVPEKTISKSKHGFGLPFGEWALENENLRSFALDNLNSLKKRDLVRPAFIDDLVDNLLPAHPHYYGVMVWVLLMLEQFFQTQSSNTGRSRRH